MTLDDLLNAETKGKWWLVGAAWAGNPLVDRQKEMEAAKAADSTHTKKKAKQVVVDEDDEELDLLGTDNHEELIKLAKKQGMNTDIRRSIFIIMMTSDVSLLVTMTRCTADRFLRITFTHVIDCRRSSSTKPSKETLCAWLCTAAAL